jgi:hypothetical protein
LAFDKFRFISTNHRMSSSCDFVKTAYTQCLEEFKEDSTQSCLFLKKGFEICSKKLSLSQLNKEIDSGLFYFPREPTKKICCACKPTRMPRDECNLKSDECDMINKLHDICLKNHGFKVRSIPSNS